MTYASDEASVETGAPSEFYEFIGPDLAVNTFRYTSGEEDIMFDPGDGGGSRLFSALPIKRTGVEVGLNGSDPAITVMVPVGCDLATRYVFQTAPPTLYMQLFRAHKTLGGYGDVVVGWEGDVLSWHAEENIASFVVPSPLVARSSEVIPRVKYQQYCNNVLYDTVCGIPRSGANVHATTVDSFPDEKTVTVVSMGTNPSGWADGGEIVHDDTGERRMVLGQTGDDITIMYPFSVNVDIGDALTIAVGCDHSLDDCVNKFNQPDGNQDNFTGMPFIVTQPTNATQSGD